MVFTIPKKRTCCQWFFPYRALSCDARLLRARDRAIRRRGEGATFFRYYIVPGIGHGGQATGLSGFNALQRVMDWREKGTVPNAVICRRVVNGKTELEMPLYPYPQQTAWDAKTSSYQPVDGPRGGVDPVAERFRPAPAE